MDSANKMNEQPSNRELMHYLEDMKVDVGEIKTQTQKTNGRVGKLEEERAFLRGGLAVLTVLVVPILFIVVKTLLKR